MAKKTPVIAPDDPTITTEVLASSIVTISEGIKKLRAGRLTEDALLLLIQHAAPTRRDRGRMYARISQDQIRTVLAGIENMAATYLKPTRTK